MHSTIGCDYFSAYCKYMKDFNVAGHTLNLLPVVLFWIPAVLCRLGDINKTTIAKRRVSQN